MRAPGNFFSCFAVVQVHEDFSRCAEDGWQQMCVPTGWVQILRGPRPKWSSASARAIAEATKSRADASVSVSRLVATNAALGSDDPGATSVLTGALKKVKALTKARKLHRQDQEGGDEVRRDHRSGLEGQGSVGGGGLQNVEVAVTACP